MKNFKSLWALALLPLLAACSNDEPAPDNGGNGSVADGVFMTITLNPNGNNGRSETNGPNSSTTGEEVGSSEENAIHSAMIVLTDADNNLIAAASVPGQDGSGSLTGGTVAGTTLYQAVAKFDKTSLASFYSKVNGNTDVRVFVFVNPTGEVSNWFNTESNIGTNNWVEDLVYTYSTVPGNIWNKTNGFTMTNVNIDTRSLPASIADWSAYSTPATAFNLSGVNNPGAENEVDNLSGNRGSVMVRRMAARMDFRDGSQIEGVGNGVQGKPFTYAVVSNAIGTTIVNVKLEAMALVNMSNTEYYMFRTSDNGLNTNATLCGNEMPWLGTTAGNYVVSTNADKKKAIITSAYSTYFQYPFMNDATNMVQSRGAGWDWYATADVLKGDPDNYEMNGTTGNFRVWRYLTENTIPSPSELQVNSQTTGVVFSGRMYGTEALNADGSGDTEAADKWEKMLYEALAYNESSVGANKLLHKNSDTDPVIYALSNGSLYITWANVQAAALAAAGFNETIYEGNEEDPREQVLDRLAPLYELVYGKGGVGVIKDEEGKVIFTDTLEPDPDCLNSKWLAWDANRSSSTAKSDFINAAVNKGKFTIYQSGTDRNNVWGYYCYYYYWNRHNDNGDNGVMGPMEFSVVRNNVYKLTVQSIKTLGHPRIPTNDPYTPEPDTPDESADVYLTVSVDVLPWVVRINNIDF